MENIKKVLLYLISAYFAYMFIKHGYLKFDPEGFWAPAFTNTWGYGIVFMYFIGFCEFAGGLTLLVPKIAKYGALLLAIVMFGAMLTRIIFGTSLDDVITIVFNMITLLYVSIERGIGTDLARLKK